jgi:hypothetical protein
MAWTIDSTLIPRIFGAAFQVLREACPLLRDVSKDYENKAGEVGDTLVIPYAAAGSTAPVTPSNATPNGADLTPAKTSITLTSHRGTAPFKILETDAWKMNMSGFVPKVIDEQIRALANYMNAQLWAAYTGVYGYAGAAGTKPFASNVNPVADVEGVLWAQGCRGANRKLYVGGSDYTQALKLSDLKTASSAGDPKALRQGYIGNLFGLDCWRDSGRTAHVAGTITTGLAAKAATAVAAGLKTCVATTAADTGACALKKGDIIAIAGQTQSTFVLTANATQAAAASDVTLTFEPALDTALAGGEAVTVKASHDVNLAGDPQGLILVIRRAQPVMGLPGMEPQGDPITVLDPETNIPLTLWRYRQYHQSTLEFTVGPFGCGVGDARFLARLAG